MKSALISLPLGILALLGMVTSETGEAALPARETLPVNIPGEASIPESRIDIALETLAQATTPYQKSHALNAIRRIHDRLGDGNKRAEIETRVAPVLHELTTTRSAEIRMDAIQAVPVFSSRGAFSLLADLLEEEENEEVLFLAGRMLGKVATREDLVVLIPFFERRNNRGLQIAIATAWLEAITRTGMPIARASVKSHVLPALKELMESPATSIIHQRIAHQLETKLRRAYELDAVTPDQPAFCIAQ